MKPTLKFLICIWLLIISSIVNAQQPSFARYKVRLFRGNPAKIRIKGNKLAEEFRTIIKDTYYSKNDIKRWHGATGLNFAGHYCFAYWGCGSPCQMSAIIDLKTGIVYEGPPASLGYEFKKNSRLLIVNPGNTADSCFYCQPKYWVLNERNKKFVQLH
jgi:hypothetical protein